jgi:hypothetical protein
MGVFADSLENHTSLFDRSSGIRKRRPRGENLFVATALAF